MKPVRRLQRTPKGQYLVTIPKDLAILLGWKPQQKHRVLRVDEKVVLE